MPLLFGTAGAVVGVSLVFWSVGLAVGAAARYAWQLRPAVPDGRDQLIEIGKRNE